MTDFVAVLAAMNQTPQTLFGIGQMGRELLGEVTYQGDAEHFEAAALVALPNGSVSECAAIVSPGDDFMPIETLASIKVPCQERDGFRVVGVNVILTFDRDEQQSYDVSVSLPLGVESVEALLAAETDALCDILAGAATTLDDLTKLSLCFKMDEGETNVPLANFICECRLAKYYFQLNQRDPYEQAIVDRLGIASQTAPLMKAA